MPTPIRFKQAYGSYDPSTIFAADEASKTLRPFSSGEAYTGSGFTFGQEQTADPGQYAGYSVGAPIDRAAVLGDIKKDLNDFQSGLFSEGAGSGSKRLATTLQDQITKAAADADSKKQAYDTLNTLSRLDEYNRLRKERQVGQTETDLISVRDAERNLERDNRAVSGNVGVMTETQLAADTAQKQIPLMLKEQTLNDRLALDNDYVTNALKLKEQDVAAAKGAYDISRTALSDAISLYKATAPENIGTNVNQTTGDIFVTFRNPLTGQTYTQKAGNVGPTASKNVDFKQIGTDQYGYPTYGFVDAANQTITPVGGSSQPMPDSGNGKSTGPGIGISTVSNVLGSWVSGDPNKEPGYSPTVYKLLSQSTGQQINSSTPVSTLRNFIPQLASAIAIAEGWGKDNNVGTRINNPGNILFIGQPNATAYKSSNGYTYAQFATVQDGWQAMYDLLGKKIGTGAASGNPEGYDLTRFTQAYYNSPQGQKVRDDERAAKSQFETNQIVKDFNTILNKQITVSNIIEAGVGGPGDLAIVFEFMKALDPNSVVRETEYDNAAKSGNIFRGMFAKFNGYLKEEGGFLPDQVKQSFKELVGIKYDASFQQYKSLAGSTRAISYRQGLNPDNVVINYDILKESPDFEDSEGLLPLLGMTSSQNDPAGLGTLPPPKKTEATAVNKVGNTTPSKSTLTVGFDPVTGTIKPLNL